MQRRQTNVSLCEKAYGRAARIECYRRERAELGLADVLTDSFQQWRRHRAQTVRRDFLRQFSSQTQTVRKSDCARFHARQSGRFSNDFLRVDLFLGGGCDIDLRLDD